MESAAKEDPERLAISALPSKMVLVCWKMILLLDSPKFHPRFPSLALLEL